MVFSILVEVFNQPKFMKILFFVAVLSFTLNSFAQTDDVLKEYEVQEDESELLIGDRGLNRFFLDGSIAVVMSNYVSKGKNNTAWGGTTNFRIGNNFYFGKGPKPVILRLTYLRFGILFANPFGTYAVFPSIGIGKHFTMKAKKANSIEPMVHVGVVGSIDDIINSHLEFYPYLSGEVKFNFSKFAFGIELSTKKFYHHTRGYYLGFSLGTRFGKGLRFSN